MSLSKTYTLRQTILDAIDDLGLTIGCVSYQERVSIVNRAVQSVFGAYFSMLVGAYIRSATITPPTTGKTGTGSVTSLVLTAASGFTFASTDVGSQFVIIISGVVYAGFITGVTSTTTATVSMISAPSTNTGTVYLFPVQTATTASLSGLSIARLGASKYGYLESTVVPQKSIAFYPYEHFGGFRPNSDWNKNWIAYSVLGETMYLNKGYNLASYGTLTYHYPGTPIPCSADTDYIDVPDGAAVEVVVLKVEEIVARRENKPVPNMQKDLAILLGTMRAELEDLNVEARKHSQLKEKAVG